MTTIRVRFIPPGSDDPVPGSIRFIPRHIESGRPISEGPDILIGDTGKIPVSAGMNSIEVRPSGAGWYYQVQGRAGNHSFSTNVLVPASGDHDFESLVRVDPKGGLAYEPDPQWQADLDNIRTLGGIPGRDGSDAYQVAVREGYEGTEQQWLNGLRGPEGQQGVRGDVGPRGERGIEGPRGAAGDRGAQGDRGLQGDKGDPGERGIAGPRGEKGEPGDVYAETRIASLETNGFIRKASLGNTNLNDQRIIGIYPQASSGNATLARNYPVGSGGRGYLTVTPVSASIVAQSYWATFLGRQFYREFDGSSWSAWQELGTVGGGSSEGLAVRPSLSTENLNDVTDIGVYSQANTGPATIANNYPVQSRGSLTVLPLGSSGRVQQYHASLASRTFYRELYGGNWSSWTELLTGSGSNGIDLAVSQVDYVEQLKRRSNTNTLELKKINSQGGVEVSCVSPSGQHVTYSFRQAGVGSGYDDYHIQSTIYVGGSSGPNRNKDTMVGPSSNRDFAIQVAPASGGLSPQWVPFHGEPTASYASTPVYLNGDAEIDLASMSTGDVIQLDSFELVQHIYGRHTEEPGTDLIEVWTTHRVSADGVLSVDGKWAALADIRLGSNYVMMVPVRGAVFDKMATSLNNSYPNSSDMYGTSTTLAEEADVATSYLFLSSGSPSLGVAFRYNNMDETMRRGRANKDASGSRAFLEHRNANFLKLYNRPWASGTVVPAGTQHRFSGDYLYTQSVGLFNQLAI